MYFLGICFLSVWHLFLVLAGLWLLWVSLAESDKPNRTGNEECDDFIKQEHYWADSECDSEN